MGTTIIIITILIITICCWSDRLSARTLFLVLADDTVDNHYDIDLDQDPSLIDDVDDDDHEHDEDGHDENDDHDDSNHIDPEFVDDGDEEEEDIDNEDDEESYHSINENDDSTNDSEQKRYCVDISSSIMHSSRYNKNSDERIRQNQYYHYHECTMDPFETRFRIDHPLEYSSIEFNDNNVDTTNINRYASIKQQYGYSLGVPQLVDGTDAEQNAINEIIRLMNNYWYDEVLSKSEYDKIRKFW